MTDVVYVLGSGSPWNDNEIRYSLRSLEMFLRDMGEVYVVGQCPSWLTNVIHLPFSDRYTCKERNIMLKTAYACGHPDLSETFLSIHDDHFCLDFQSAGDIPNWCGTTLENLARSVTAGNHWKDAVVNTDRALQAGGFSTLNFDLHLPILFSKHEYPRVMDMYDWPGKQRGFVVKSLYANTMRVTPTRYHDMKVDKHHTLPELVAKLKGRPWFSLGNGGLNGYFRKLLPALYPEPSKFER